MQDEGGSGARHRVVRASGAAAVAPGASPVGVSLLSVSPRWVAAFGLLVLLTYFGSIGVYPFADPDEPRYAEIPREMLELHDWITPHLNYVQYFEKPPLMYWLTALGFRAFGIHEWSARLWPAVFGLVGIVMAYVLGRSMFDAWTGYAAAGLLAAAPLYFGLSQVVVLDAAVSALMAVALGAVWLAYAGRHRRTFTMLAYVATALAVLTKGPMALLLPGAIVILFLILRRELGALRWLCSPRGILAFAAIALPWFILVSVRNPGFVDFFLVRQHFDRFFRPDEHRQPPWFFVPIVLGGSLPWSAMVLLAPGVVVPAVRRAARLQLSAGGLFCATWSGVIFTFFSCSGSKLGTYVLPMFCPAAILLARFFRSVLSRNDRPVMVRACGAVLVLGVAALAAAVLAPFVVDDPQVGEVVPSIAAAGGGLVVTAIAAWVAIRRRDLQAAFAVLLAGALVVQVVGFSARRAATQYRALGTTIRRLARPQDLVVSYRQYVIGVNFYARHRLILTGGPGELTFGSQQGDQHQFFWNGDAPLIEAWRSARHIFLVINRPDLEALETRLHPAPREIAAQRQKVVVVNFD